MLSDYGHPDQATIIADVQRYLRQLALTSTGDTTPPGTVLLPPVDGVWDSLTSDALRAFQRAEDLPETGRTDPVTWERLYRAYLRSLEGSSPAARVKFFPERPVGAQLEIGSTHPAVWAVRWMLGELALQFRLPPLPNDGPYDEATAEAVRIFQAASGLPVTGSVDRVTWNRLVSQYESHLPSDDG
jgi:peptidoglycan hydrolase-like protein with peptidoglycan-binding domain